MDRTEAILDTLTVKVPLLTTDQVTRTWWSESRAGHRAAEKHLAELVADGLLDRRPVKSHPELRTDEPMFVWKPGDSPPEYGPLAYRAKLRWADPEVQMVGYTATPRAARLFSGYVPTIKADAISHDVFLGALYLRYLRDCPADAEDWVSEYFIAPTRGFREVVPDAALLDDADQPRKIVEVLGCYPPKRLFDLHADCAKRGLPYEFW